MIACKEKIGKNKKSKNYYYLLSLHFLSIYICLISVLYIFVGKYELF